jgi:hypothetical protein
MDCPRLCGQHATVHWSTAHENTAHKLCADVRLRPKLGPLPCNLQDETLLLDPPSLIFVMRLHLLGVARRKNAAAAALLAPPAAGRTVRSQHSSRHHRPHIPPPVPLPAWAQQELAQQHSQAASGSLQAVLRTGRQLLDAPDALCCPITGQVRCCAVLPGTMPFGMQCHVLKSRVCCSICCPVTTVAASHCALKGGCLC